MKLKGRMFLEGEPWVEVKDSIEKLPGIFRDKYESGKVFFIPINKIKSVEFRPHEIFSETSELTLNFSKQSYNYFFNKVNL